jgi:ketosteroid isomerase-like protein
MTSYRLHRGWLACALVAAAAAQAQEPSPGTAEATTAVESFHAALAAGDREGALSWLDPQVVIFESGAAEKSRDEYASHHLQADLEFEGAVTTEVLDRQTHSAGDAAWVLTRTRTTGTFRGRDLDLEGVETMLLRRVNRRWSILHVHWSSRSRRAG